MILHYLHTVVASEYWKKEEWQLWADKLILQNDEFVEWIYDVAVARSKEELYLAIAYEKIIEVVDKERFYWEPDVIIGYYYLMYKEGRMDLSELFLKLLDEDDISSEAELFDFPEVVQMLNKAKIGEMDTEKIDEILYPLARIASEQIEALKQYTFLSVNGKP